MGNENRGTILQGDVLQSKDQNTKLYLRMVPPSLDGSPGSAKANGEYLGIVVLAPGVPRWMSQHFAEALQAHDLGTKGADLNLYSHDWFEKIVYVPDKEVEKLQNVSSLDPYILPQDLVSHSLSTGCQQVTARTLVLPARVDGNSLVLAPELSRAELKDPQYAIVSQHYANDLSKMAEITITPLSNVPNFADSPLHKQRLADSYILRHDAVVKGQITGQRCKSFDAVRASHHAP